MEEKDLKAIQKIVEEEIKPVKVDMDSVKGDLVSVKGDLASVKVDMDSVKGDLREIKETVDANNTSLINLENTIGGYKDALDVERKRIDKHEEKFKAVEESLGPNI